MDNVFPLYDSEVLNTTKYLFVASTRYQLLYQCVPVSISGRNHVCCMGAPSKQLGILLFLFLFL